MPLLSIVTTVYDRADSLASCVRSVANLDWQDYEHIIVADHPPEDSFEALERVVAEAADARVGLYNLPERTNDLGISPAQAGLRRAEGKYVAFLDDDNVYLPSHFNALIDCLENNPGLGFAYSACLWNAELLLNAPSPSEGRIDLGQLLFRRDLFRVHFNDELRYSGYTWDWQLIAELLSRSVAFRFIDRETFIFRAAQFPLLEPEAPLESARKRIAELVRAAQHARRDFAEATRGAQDEIVRLHREHERLSLAYRDLDQEHGRLASAHVDLQGEHDRLSHAYRDLEQERGQLANAHVDLQREHDRLSRAHRELEQEHDGLRRAQEDLRDEREQLGGALRQRSAEVAMLRQEHAVATETSARRLGALQYRLDSVLTSRVWRWTAPVRAFIDALGGGR